MFSKSLCSVALLGTLSVPIATQAATWTPDASLPNPQLHQRLYEIGRKYAEANFDPEANLVGASSKHPPNKKQHSTRESASYAYGLLLTGDPADRDRAQAILKKVLATQDTTSQGLTLGAFGWYAEDKPTDLNSAAFVGLTLADVIDLDRRHPALDPGLRQQIEEATKLAVLEVMHRDIDPGYTNIALLSVALTAAGEKLFHMPVAGAFSEAKLDGVMKLADDSEFAEYLSPTYGAVDFSGAYHAKRFAFSDSFTAKVDGTIAHLWKQFALSYHAPTCQLSGPAARSYGDNMLDYAAGMKYIYYLALGGNYPMPDTDTDHDWDKDGLMIECELPIGTRDEFKTPPPAWRDFNVANTGTPIRHLFQYREGNFVLGTVGFQDEWKQKRNLVSYWRNDDAAAPNGFNVGYCIDESNETVNGFPPQYIHFYSQQKKGAALVGLAATKGGPKDPASAQLLVFDKLAQPTGGTGGEPMKVVDGTITTYVFPIGGSGAALESKADERNVHVTRNWTTADTVGDLKVLAYLIVFRPSNQPAPTVSESQLGADQDGSAFASVKLDGDAFKIPLTEPKHS